MNKNLLVALRRQELICSQNFIGGKWIASRASEVYEVSNPAVDKIIAEDQAQMAQAAE